MKSIEEYAYFIGLLPYQFMEMTLSEIYKMYDYRIKKNNMDNELSDRRTARICALLANINRDKKRKPNPFSENDFMPRIKEKHKKEQTTDQMYMILKAFTIANGGKDLTK